ncbi:MAG: hypothetical protein LBQ60_05325 [Bacteroidales bacterium]|nr:hypothetical protein [Bacteroidales bacterium]
MKLPLSKHEFYTFFFPDRLQQCVMAIAYFENHVSPMRFELTFPLQGSTALNALPYLQMNVFGASAKSTHTSAQPIRGYPYTLRHDQSFSAGFSF